MTAFRGFPRELFAFYEGLQDNNSKAYWTANNATWEQHVRPRALRRVPSHAHVPAQPRRAPRQGQVPLQALGGRHQRVPCRGRHGLLRYVSVSAAGMVTGCGAMALARDQLQRFRAALDDDHSGRAFEELRTKLDARSLPVTCGAQPPLKTGPRGYPPDHPRVELLRWKGAVVIQEYEPADWMHTPAARDRIREVWHGARPLKEWIDAPVGATNEPVRSARGRQK